jgi:hypothetical protein
VVKSDHILTIVFILPTLTLHSGHNLDAFNNAACTLISDSELDSGISVNGNYDEPRHNNHPPEIYEQIDELESSQGIYV